MANKGKPSGYNASAENILDGLKGEIKSKSQKIKNYKRSIEALQKAINKYKAYMESQTKLHEAMKKANPVFYYGIVQEVFPDAKNSIPAEYRK